MIKTNLIIGWRTDTIHALHKYAYALKDSFDASDASNASREEKIRAKIITCERVLSSGIGEELTNYFRYPFVVKKEAAKADVNHITSQEFAYLNACPVLSGSLKNCIVTVHDIFPITLDAPYTRFNYKWRIQLGLKGIRNAKAVICNSQYTKDSIARKGIDKEKCTVIPMGFDEHKYGIRNYSQYKSLYKRFNLDENKQYVLHVGSENERKNVLRLVQAFAILKKKNKDAVLLRVGRIQNDSHHQLVEKEIQRLDIKDSIKYIGQLNDEDLVRIYNLADIFVFPSLYEGFGMPVVESFACGCPTVSSTGPPMKEIAGDAALLANPRSTKDIADRMAMLLGDKQLQKKLARKGIQRAKMYSWRKIAEQTKEVYEEVLKR